MRNIQHKLSVARGEQCTELVFKNARVVNVFSGEIYKTNVAVEDGRVVRIGVSRQLGSYLVLRDTYGDLFTYAGLGSLAPLEPCQKALVRRGFE